MTSCARTRSARRSRDALGAPPAGLLSAPGLRGPDRILKSFGGFLRDSRAGATTIAAVAITVMAVMGASLITDHLWFVGKRDLLKAASDAATVATTLRLRSMPLSTDDATVETTLQEIADRYVWFNLKSNLNDAELEADDVVTTLDINRTMGLVNVRVDAPIGKSLLSRIVGYAGPGQIRVASGADAGTGPVWAVLALDTSRSMNTTLDGRVPVDPDDQRMEIVRAAAKDFVEQVLSEDAADADTPSPTVSIGVVPWSVSAKLWCSSAVD